VIEADEDRAEALFHALADRTRRDIMRRVLAGEHSVSVLAVKYQMSFAAVQKHVVVLEKAGLLTKRRSGREQLASGDVAAVGRWRPCSLSWNRFGVVASHASTNSSHPTQPRRTEPCPSPTSSKTSTT
jgi:DNA-binding transcriptional ArsR family regulator